MAVELAELTEHQQLVINLRWTVGFTQEEVARFLGITQPAVYQAEKAAERKVQSVLYQWGQKT